MFPTHPARLAPVSVYTRLAHANENGIKLGNLNGQKTLRASRRPPLSLSQSVSDILSERAGRWAINQKMLVCKSNPIFDGGTNVTATCILILATWRGVLFNLGIRKKNSLPFLRVMRTVHVPSSTSQFVSHLYCNALCLLSTRRYEYR